MNELLMKRIQRKLENLTDEHGYRVLDYVEFLESKYGTRDHGDTVFDKIADGVEDTLRATRVPKAAIRGTMGAVDTAGRVLDQLARASRAAVDELGRALTSEPAAEAKPAVAETEDASAEKSEPPPEKPQEPPTSA